MGRKTSQTGTVSQPAPAPVVREIEASIIRQYAELRLQIAKQEHEKAKESLLSRLGNGWGWRSLTCSASTDLARYAAEETIAAEVLGMLMLSDHTPTMRQAIEDLNERAMDAVDLWARNGCAVRSTCPMTSCLETINNEAQMKTWAEIARECRRYLRETIIEDLQPTAAAPVIEQQS